MDFDDGKNYEQGPSRMRLTWKGISGMENVGCMGYDSVLERPRMTQACSKVITRVCLRKK